MVAAIPSLVMLIAVFMILNQLKGQVRRDIELGEQRGQEQVERGKQRAQQEVEGGERGGSGRAGGTERGLGQGRGRGSTLDDHGTR